jgi:hypothetical protein
MYVHVLIHTYTTYTCHVLDDACEVYVCMCINEASNEASNICHVSTHMYVMNVCVCLFNFIFVDSFP